jgi:hypothetical protein
MLLQLIDHRHINNESATELRAKLAVARISLDEKTEEVTHLRSYIEKQRAKIRSGLRKPTASYDPNMR